MAKTIDKVFRNLRLPDGTPSAIAVAQGKIAHIGTDIAPEAGTEVVDLGGQLVVPGFVEGHIHLDTSFYGDAWRPHVPYTAGFNVRERVEIQHRNMAAAAPMDQRARNQLELCIANGSTQMRSHVMVDASVGLKSLETIAAVREQYRHLIDIQLVAFPQSGILSSPGTADLLDAAFDHGADLIGGLDPVSFDRDSKGHLDVVFGIADKRGVSVDIHLHEPNMMGIFSIEEIAARRTGEDRTFDTERAEPPIPEDVIGIALLRAEREVKRENKKREEACSSIASAHRRRGLGRRCGWRERWEDYSTIGHHSMNIPDRHLG